MSEIGDPLRARLMTPVDDPDREILARVVAGQTDALEGLYDRYRSMAYAIALRITADTSMALDLWQIKRSNEINPLPYDEAAALPTAIRADNNLTINGVVTPQYRHYPHLQGALPQFKLYQRAWC